MKDWKDDKYSLLYDIPLFGIGPLEKLEKAFEANDAHTKEVSAQKMPNEGQEVIYREGEAFMGYIVWAHGWRRGVVEIVWHSEKEMACFTIRPNKRGYIPRKYTHYEHANAIFYNEDDGDFVIELLEGYEGPVGP